MTTPQVTIEVRPPGAAWRPAGTVCEMEPPGSISSHEPTGRQLIIFGWWEGRPGVWRSTIGFDISTPAFREVTSAHLKRLADLTEGPYERDVWTIAGRVRGRWTLVP